VITDILRPATARDAVRAKCARGAAYLGGGTWLNSGRAEGITTLVSLEKLGLGTIEADGAGCVIGAACTLQQIVDSPFTPRALKDAARLTASRTLRNMKTVGGELGMDAADSAVIPVLMVMGALLRLASKRRPVSIEDYLDKPGDLVLSVALPDAGRPCAVKGLARTSHSPRSLVVAACITGTGQLRQLLVVLSDCAGKRARLLETAAAGAALPTGERLASLVVRVFTPRADMHASVPYKVYMAGVLVADTVLALAAGTRAS
jgi:probable selenate reductase FAD-binding subunit